MKKSTVTGDYANKNKRFVFLKSIVTRIKLNLSSLADLPMLLAVTYLTGRTIILVRSEIDENYFLVTRWGKQ